MLQDKQVALDFLLGSKSTIIDLTKAALEASASSQLKQTLLQMRDQAEQTHEEIYHIAERTGAYIPSAPVDHKYVNRVGQFFQQNMVNNQYQGGFGGGQYATVSQGSYQNTNQGYGTSNTNTGQYQSGSTYNDNVNPLKNEGSQYYRNK